jgi:hypothetical protein
MDEVMFKPTDKAREVLRRMNDAAMDAMQEQFFELWEAEGDPRRAGSIAAHAYITNAAKIAVFGSRCAGLEPQSDLWRAACEDALTNAIRAVDIAFILTPGEQSP